jgi:ABC-type multidrug transport system fused ATPase/permease subunit
MSIPKKLYQLMTPDQRRAAAGVFGLMLIGMVLETLGIGLVIPALAILTQSDLAVRYPMVAPWLVRLGNPTPERLIIAGMLVLIGVTAVKTLFLAFLAWRQVSLVFALQSHLSQRLFAGYLGQPYTFHLQHNSAQLLRNTTWQVGEIGKVMQHGLTLMTEVLVLAGISTLLLMIEPLGAILVVSILGLAGWGFNRLTRARVLLWGTARQHHEGLRIQHLQQGLGGAKDVKLLGREDDFLTQFELHNVGSARIGQREATLHALPRLWLELLAVTSLGTLVLTMIWRGKPLGLLLPALALFTAAAFRIMPSVNRILNAIQHVRFSLPVINTIHDEFQLLDATAIPRRGEPLPFERGLVLDQVSFRYPSAETQALTDVSLSVPRRACVGFIGGSGAGKTTLVDVLLGLLAPSSGAVRVDGVDIQSNMRGWQDQIGYVPQSVFLTDDTMRRNVAFGLPNENIDDQAVWQAIRAAQLEEFVNELPRGLDTLVGERGVRLSGGQRQRIGIARALYHDPPVLVLDEATNSLDSVTEQGVMDAVRALQGDKTLLIVAHRPSTLRYCDRLFRLDSGRVVEEGEAAVVLANLPHRAAFATQRAAADPQQ